jgi:dienelactone hydrolase
VALPAAASSPVREPNGEAAHLFAYKRDAPFDLKEESAREQDGVTIRDLNYAAYDPRHGRIRAYLIRPSGKGPFAGVLFFHWLGKPNPDRNEFLDEAVALAKQGTVSLLIQGFFPWSEPPTEAQADRQRVVDQVIAVRRSLDLLLSQPKVDRKRVGFVGHDYGAMYGAIVAGVDRRVKAYVLMAGTPSFSDWSLKYWPATGAQGKEAYQKTLSAVDPIQHVSHAAPAALLFQFAKTDEFIPETVANAFFDAASEPKQIKRYTAEHDLNIEAARQDRRAWLAQQLGLAKAG